jgi:hypothetical protein
MKNITLAVDEKVLTAARRYAGECGSGVNTLVREHLNRIAQHDDRARKARARLRELSKRSRAKLGEKTWTRQDLHER